MNEMRDMFWYWVRERHSIYKKRKAGEPAPWTEDPILKTYRFTNVYRELDRTTLWFKDNVRNPLYHYPEVLLATVVFRWFNRIETGELLLNTQSTEHQERTQYGLFEWWDTDIARSTLTGHTPIVTGAYIIKTPDGYDKLNGVLWCIDAFRQHYSTYQGRRYQYEELAADLINRPEHHSLEDMWKWLINFPFMGPFMAYEVVTDLRHTALQNQARDMSTWANAGPGAMRGLNRIAGRPLEYRSAKHGWQREMRDLLAEANYPRIDGTFPAFELREIEHSLCEFDKYARVKLGEGAPRQRYNGG